MIRWHFDLYDDPEGPLLVRFTQPQSAEYRGEANGTGAGRITIRATDAEAAFINPMGLQYVRVVRDDESTELVIGGFFTERGSFSILSQNSDKLLSIGGSGPLTYLQRGVMDADSWIDDPFIGTDPQPDGTWPLHLAGTGNELGAILWRVLHELEEPGRHQNPVPAMSLGFTHLLDSNGDPWVRTSGDFVAQVTDTAYSIAKRLMELGLYIEVDPDTFEVRAYEPETHRRDRTGGAFAANVVRFEAGVNIKSDATRELEARIRRNALLVGSNDTWEWVTDPGVTTPWEGGYILDDESGTSLADAGAAQIAARSDAGDVFRFRMQVGDDELNGKYLPFEHVKLDDLVTVHTGTGALDYDEQDFPVASLTLTLRQGGDWDCWVDLGSIYTSMQERAFQAAPVKAHNHPPNPKLCPPTTESPAASCLINPSALAAIDGDNSGFELGTTAGWTFNQLGGSLQGPASGAWSGQYRYEIIGAGFAFYQGWTGFTIPAGETVVVYPIAPAGITLRFGRADETDMTEVVAVEGVNCIAWTPDADTAAEDVFLAWVVESGLLNFVVDTAHGLLRGGGVLHPYNGISPMAARCDHTHPEDEESEPVDVPVTASDLTTYMEPHVDYDGHVIINGLGDPVMVEVAF